MMQNNAMDGGIYMNKTKNFYGYVSNNTFWNRKKNEYYNGFKEENGDPDPYGWTNEELANALGYTVGAIQSWFSGRVVPGEEACEDICKFFDIDPEHGMALFIKDHDDYVKAHGNPNQVTIEDVMNDNVPENFITWNKRNKAIHIFNVLAANQKIDMCKIGTMVQYIFRDGISNKSTITDSLGRLNFNREITIPQDYNEFYETLRPYILAEKGETNG